MDLSVAALHIVIFVMAGGGEPIIYQKGDVYEMAECSAMIQGQSQGRSQKVEIDGRAVLAEHHACLDISATAEEIAEEAADSAREQADYDCDFQRFGPGEDESRY